MGCDFEVFVPANGIAGISDEIATEISFWTSSVGMTVTSEHALLILVVTAIAVEVSLFSLTHHA
jgi:hypothetical protein